MGSRSAKSRRDLTSGEMRAAEHTAECADAGVAKGQTQPWATYPGFLCSADFRQQRSFLCFVYSVSTFPGFLRYHYVVHTGCHILGRILLECTKVIGCNEISPPNLKVTGRRDGVRSGEDLVPTNCLGLESELLPRSLGHSFRKRLPTN